MVKSAPKTGDPKKESFEQTYPNITKWVKARGWIEIGVIDGFSNFVLALDEGGMVWEGKNKYKTMDEAFRALEGGLSAWVEEQYGEE